MREGLLRHVQTFGIVYKHRAFILNKVYLADSSYYF